MYPVASTVANQDTTQLTSAEPPTDCLRMHLESIADVLNCQPLLLIHLVAPAVNLLVFA